MRAQSIQTPRGKWISRPTYVARVERLSMTRDGAWDCEHGHYECAAWKRGPCSEEVRSYYECRGHEPQPGSSDPQGVTVYCDGTCRQIARAMAKENAWQTNALSDSEAAQ